jgi:hypothetical protein
MQVSVSGCRQLYLWLLSKEYFGRNIASAASHIDFVHSYSYATFDEDHLSFNTGFLTRKTPTFQILVLSQDFAFFSRGFILQLQENEFNIFWNDHQMT